MRAPALMGNGGLPPITALSGNKGELAHNWRKTGANWRSKGASAPVVFPPLKGGNNHNWRSPPVRLQNWRKGIAAWGEPERVLTGTERKIAEGIEYLPSRTAGKACEVCGSTQSVHEHHWAPFHLFGAEAAKWPTSFLCQPCHSRWHSVVTPRMGKRNA